MIIATVDMGTTNSRIRLIENNKIIAYVKSEVGIKDVSITGKSDLLIIELKRITEQALKIVNRNINEIMYFIASGMITSNLGICEVPHKICPVGINDLRENIVKKNFKEFPNIPFYFIPGVKNRVLNQQIDFLHDMDMMRGEEVESFGIMELCKAKGPFLLILPGSHTKIVYVDEFNRIEKSSSSLAGELIYCVTNFTILSQCLNKKLVSEIDLEYIVRGMKFEEKHNLTKAFFAIRLMDTQLSTTENQRANFLAGAIISNDISREILHVLNNKNYSKIYIGGSNPLKEIFKIVLDNKGLNHIEIVSISDEITEIAPTIGALKIAKI